MIGEVGMNLAFALALCIPLSIMVGVYALGVRQERRRRSDQQKP